MSEQMKTVGEAPGQDIASEKAESAVGEAAADQGAAAAATQGAALSGADGVDAPADAEAADEAPEGSAVDESTEEELAAARELAENNALADVFDDVRRQSSDSQLVVPSRWVELGLIPGHMTSDEFEMLVYEVLVAYRRDHKDEIAAEKAERACPKYHRKAAIIKEYFAQLPQKPMCEIVSVEIRRLLPFWKLSERNLKLLSGFWDWCIRNKYCTGTNPFPTLTRRTRSPDEKAKAAETPEVLDEADVEKVFHALMDDAVQTAKACAMALQLFGGLNVSQIRALT